MFPVDVRQDVARIDPDRLGIVEDGPVMVRLDRPGMATVVVGLGHLQAQADRRVVIGDRPIDISDGLPGRSPVRVAGRSSGQRRNGAGIIVDRPHNVTPGQPVIAAIDQRRREASGLRLGRDHAGGLGPANNHAEVSQASPLDPLDRVGARGPTGVHDTVADLQDRIRLEPDPCVPMAVMGSSPRPGSDRSTSRAA